MIAGKDKGKKGKILRVLPDAGRVVVEGINVSKRRQRPRKEGQKGQVIDVAMPVHASNVQLFDAKSGKRTRIGYEVKDGKKVRLARKSGVKI